MGGQTLVRDAATDASGSYISLVYYKSGWRRTGLASQSYIRSPGVHRASSPPKRCILDLIQTHSTRGISPYAGAKQRERAVPAPAKRESKRPRTCEPAPLAARRIRSTDPSFPFAAFYSRDMPGRLRMSVRGTPCRRTRLVVSPVPSLTCSRADGDAGAQRSVLPPHTFPSLANRVNFLAFLL